MPQRPPKRTNFAGRNRSEASSARDERSREGQETRWSADHGRDQNRSAAGRPNSGGRSSSGDRPFARDGTYGRGSTRDRDRTGGSDPTGGRDRTRGDGPADRDASRFRRGKPTRDDKAARDRTGGRNGPVDRDASRFRRGNPTRDDEAARDRTGGRNGPADRDASRFRRGKPTRDDEAARDRTGGRNGPADRDASRFRRGQPTRDGQPARDRTYRHDDTTRRDRSHGRSEVPRADRSYGRDEAPPRDHSRFHEGTPPRDRARGRNRPPARDRITPRSRGEHFEPERLQKVLARAGLASRREVEDWIRAGRITVNGELATLGVRVSPTDQVRLDGRLIRQREAPGRARVFLCHRSPGEDLRHPIEDDARDEAAREDHEAPRAALLERLPRRAGRRFITVSPMPRVDGGLELVTSDGELAAKLQRSVRGLVSEFSVRVRGELSDQQVQGVLTGVLDSGDQLTIEHCEPGGGEGANRWYTVTTRGASGKEIRQLFERQGALVSRVLRTHLGPLTLERALSRGHFRELTGDELRELLAATEPAPPEA